MKTSKKLIENSIAAILSAIEIYNKPDFKYRNEVFTILVINSWELLLKAKILHENNENIQSIYAFDRKGNLKTNRNSTPLTIEIMGAIHELELDEVLTDNLLSLIEIRDTAIHFINEKPLDYLIHSLGAANLKNYQKLIYDWFDRTLLEYNFYILPLGFAHHFSTFKIIELEKEPEIIQNIIANIAANQEKKSENGFQFTCEIEVNIKSAKKVTDETDLTIAIDRNASQAVTIIKHQKLTDRYPLSSTELVNKIKLRFPEIKQNDFYRFMREMKVRETSSFSVYNFRYKRHEEDYLNTGKVATATPSLYSDECLNFCLTELPKWVDKNKNSQIEII